MFLVLFIVNVGLIISGYFICFLNLKVCFIVFIMLFFGIGMFKLFINVLNILWFFVCWIDVSLVFNNWMLLFWSILFLCSWIVMFKFVWLFKVGSKVLGCFLCIICVIKLWVNGLIYILFVIFLLVMIVVGFEFIRIIWYFFFFKVRYVCVLV